MNKNSETYRHYEKLAAQLTTALFAGNQMQHNEPTISEVKDVYSVFLERLLKDRYDDNIK